MIKMEDDFVQLETNGEKLTNSLNENSLKVNELFKVSDVNDHFAKDQLSKTYRTFRKKMIEINRYID